MTAVRVENTPPPGWRRDGATLITIVLLFSMIVPSRFVYPPLGGVGRPDVLIGFGLLLWWLLSLLVPRLTPRGRNPLRWILALWLVVDLLSLVSAYQRPLSTLERSGTERVMIGVLSSIGIVLICSEAIRSRDRVETLLKRLTYLGGFLAAVGSLQFYADIDISRYLVPPGLALNESLLGIGSRSGLNRVSGTSIHAIEYGSVLALILPLAIHFAVHAKSKWESQWRWGLAGFIFLSGLYSISRTNTVAVTLVLVMLVALWTARQRLNAVVTGIAALVVVRVAVPGLLGTLKSLFLRFGTDPSIEARTSDYPTAFRYVAERPVFGRGAGTWNVEQYLVLDNHWLGTLVQTGWLGVFAGVTLLVVPFAMARHILNTGRDDEWRHLGGVLAAQLVLVFMVGFFFDSGGFPQFHMIQMVLIGVVGAMWRIESRHDPRDVRLGVRDDLLKSTKSWNGTRHGLARPWMVVVDGPGAPSGRDLERR